jgi:Mg-chelatase subunit ChlD
MEPEKKEEKEKKEEISQKIDIHQITKMKSFKAEVIDDPQDIKNVFVNLSLEPEKVYSRKPIVFIAMIDVSGSMKMSSTQDMKENEEIGISRLGLVRHALKTIGFILGEYDKMSLITFNGKAKVCLEATNMNQMGRNLLFDEIEKMNAFGFTNIWDALRLGIIEAQKYDEKYNISLLLFTDGEPNENPKIGLIPALKKSLSDINNVNFTISTFTFGYNVNSILMEEIAQVGNGIYGYCPDYSMVGTIFINYMSNVLNIVEPIVKIKVKNKFLEKTFEIGGLYSGIARHFGFFLNKNDFKNTEITLFLGNEEKNTIKGIDYTVNNSSIMDQYYRNKLINLIIDNLKPKDFIKAQMEIKKLFNEINKIKKKTEFMKNLLVDLINGDPNHGQILKAFQ